MLITILATLGGVIVVGAGGGLIRPMQSRWENWLNTAERETQNVKAHVRQSPGTRQQADQLKDQYQEQYDDAGPSNGSSSATYAERPVDLRTTDPSAETRQI